MEYFKENVKKFRETRNVPNYIKRSIVQVKYFLKNWREEIKMKILIQFSLVRFSDKFS